MKCFFTSHVQFGGEFFALTILLWHRTVLLVNYFRAEIAVFSVMIKIKARPEVSGFCVSKFVLYSIWRSSAFPNVLEPVSYL